MFCHDDLWTKKPKEEKHEEKRPKESKEAINHKAFLDSGASKGDWDIWCRFK